MIIAKIIDKKGSEYSYPINHELIYERMMKITENDQEISDDAASWCEIASVGEIYEYREGEIKILEKGV